MVIARVDLGHLTWFWVGGCSKTWVCDGEIGLDKPEMSGEVEVDTKSSLTPRLAFSFGATRKGEGWSWGSKG